MQIENASQFPKVYYCRHMQPGTARYEREGIVLVDTDAVKNLINSVGKRSIPVYIGHQNVDLKNIKEQAVGYVTDSFYNALDGWAWFKFIAVDDAAHEAIKKGWAVSNAYMPSEIGPGGTKNNVPYKSEVRNGEFTHLAIVPDPRYEGACIMTPEEYKTYQDDQKSKLNELHNSKPKGPRMLKMFKNKKEEVAGSEVDLDTHIELEDGKSLSIREMVEAVVENSKKEAATVEVNGKRITVEELVEEYKNAKGKKMKKNGESKMERDAEEEDVDGDQDEEGDDEIGEDKKNRKTKKNAKKMKKNAGEDEDDCMSNDAEDGDDTDMSNKKKEKKNSADAREVDVDDKFFTELKNANLRPMVRNDRSMVTTAMDGVARGKARYGSKDGMGRITK